MPRRRRRPDALQLYGFFRSSTSFRLRIALAYKGMAWEPKYVNLPKMEHHDPAYLGMNPQGLVPALVDDAGRELGVGRELAEIRTALQRQARAASASVAREEPAAGQAARAHWEKPAQTAWTFGDFPAQVPVAAPAGVPVFAFPGLRAVAGGVELRLHKTPEEARAATRRGLAALFERLLGHDLGWLERDLRALRELGPLAATLAPTEALQAQALATIRRWVCDPDRVAAESGGSAAAFAAALAQAKADLRGLVPRLTELLREILALRQALLVHPTPPPGLEADLATLLAPDFLGRTPWAQLAQFPRYLKAWRLRADRWRQHPGKDAERLAQLAPYLAALARLEPAGGEEPAPALRWLVEEFRVSLFAQELGTAEPVSAVKLDRALAALKAPPGQPGAAAPPSSPTPAKPIMAALVNPKKVAPIKNLGALDKLFGR